MLQFIFAGGVIICLWVIVCVVLNIFMYPIFESYPIVIKMRKNNKYDGKVDPIYELRQSDYSIAMYVYKWELGYGIKTWSTILCFFLFPYPVSIKFYCYHENESHYYACDKIEIDKIGDLKELYETKDAKEKAEWAEANKEKIAYQNKMNELNKVFNENYE